MDRKSGGTVEYQIRAGDGETVISAGKRTADGEVIVNRGKPERLYERPSDSTEEFVEVGAYASGPVAVSTERPNLEMLGLHAVPACTCGAVNGACNCGMPNRADEQTLPDDEDKKLLNAVLQLKAQDEARQAQWNNRKPTETPIQSTFIHGRQRDNYGAPGEFGQYSVLNPQPIDIIEGWGMNYLEGSALTYLARHRRKGGKLDLEKAIWFLNRLIETEYGAKSL